MYRVGVVEETLEPVMTGKKALYVSSIGPV